MDASRCPQCGKFSTSLLLKAFDLSVAPGTRHDMLLNTNEPPEDSDVTFTQSIVSKTDARMACLDTEISKLQATLKQLKEERVSLSSYRTRNTAILSPLRRMPPEVLGEIFFGTLPSLNDEWARGRFDIADSPWVLTRVSSHWRAISLSTPSLWSQVAVDYSQDRKTSPVYYSLALVEAQIQRAQKLKIHFYGCETAASSPQIQLFQLLSQHSSRWEELSLGLTSGMVSLLPALRDRVPSLKRLWINWISPKSETAAQSIDCFRFAPSLVAFGTFNEYRFIPIAFPMHEITHYQLDGPWESHRGILKLASNLVEARITIRFDAELWSNKEGIIDLPHLRHLYVSHTEVFCYLRTPALEGLGFWVQDNAGDILPDLESFLGRSTCLLRRLSLAGFPDAHSTTEMLQKFPSVTELVIAIEQCHASEEINLLMSTLTTTGSTAVAPQLRCLFFGCEDETYIDYSLYLKMLESRWRETDCTLKSVALATEGPGPDSATLCGLHALRREGLNLFLVKGVEASHEIDSWFYATSWND